LSYFYLICLYLKMKIRNINDDVQQYITRRNFTNQDISYIIQSLTFIHLEISEYNKKYWSKFSVILLVFFVTFMNTVLFLVLFKDMHIILKISLFYAFMLSFIIITFYLKTASGVSYEAVKSYKLLIKLSMTCDKRVIIGNKVKVAVLYSSKNMNSFLFVLIFNFIFQIS